MDYDAVTIDTQTIITNGFDLDGKLLAQLKQFRQGPTRVVISQIVAQEILKHLRESTKEARQHIESAHRKAQLFGLKPKDRAAFLEAPDTDCIAKERLDRYLDETGAIIVTPDDLAIDDVLKMYFEALPPFARAGKKKNEFPDAFALLSLQKWAAKNNMRILAVSGDPDWAKFGEGCAEIDVVAQLSDALEKLQTDLNRAAVVIEELLSDIRSGRRHDLYDQLELHLDRETEHYPVIPDGNSRYSVEGSDGQMTLKSFDFAGDTADFRIIQAGPEKIVVDVDFVVVVDASATFALEIYDTVDKDYVSMGSVETTCDNTELTLTALVTFAGDFEKKNVEIEGVELLGDSETIDFGEIEPDYGNDEPE